MSHFSVTLSVKFLSLSLSLYPFLSFSPSLSLSLSLSFDCCHVCDGYGSCDGRHVHHGCDGGFGDDCDNGVEVVMVVIVVMVMTSLSPSPLSLSKSFPSYGKSMDVFVLVCLKLVIQSTCDRHI